MLIVIDVEVETTSITIRFRITQIYSIKISRTAISNQLNMTMNLCSVQQKNRDLGKEKREEKRVSRS